MTDSLFMTWRETFSTNLTGTPPGVLEQGRHNLGEVPRGATGVLEGRSEKHPRWYQIVAGLRLQMISDFSLTPFYGFTCFKCLHLFQFPWFWSEMGDDHGWSWGWFCWPTFRPSWIPLMNLKAGPIGGRSTASRSWMSWPLPSSLCSSSAATSMPTWWKMPPTRADPSTSECPVLQEPRSNGTERIAWHQRKRRKWLRNEPLGS